jgi:hypothetical protein
MQDIEFGYKLKELTRHIDESVGYMNREINSIHPVHGARLANIRFSCPEEGELIQRRKEVLDETYFSALGLLDNVIVPSISELQNLAEPYKDIPFVKEVLERYNPQAIRAEIEQIKDTAKAKWEL